jgi:flagellar biosynthetic protein FliP
MSSESKRKRIGFTAGMVLAIVTPGFTQVQAPTGAPQSARAQAAQSQLSAAQGQIGNIIGGPMANPATAQAVTQSSQPAAVQPALPNGPMGTVVAPRRVLSPGSPRITREPAGAAGQPTNIGGVVQIPGVQEGSVPWSVVVMLTVLTLVPSILVCMTPFARLLIVFHFLRQALGLQTTPSNQTLIGLSLILTFFLMQPVASQIYTDALVPMQANQITAIDALGRAEVPMSHFMAHYVRDKDVALFQDLAHEPRPASMNDVSMRVLLPAYILSELKAGFQIGTVLFLPFLIVDMVVASITTSVGMLQLPPVVISTPLKLLLFLMVDGWHLLISSLMRSFQ